MTAEEQRSDADRTHADVMELLDFAWGRIRGRLDGLDNDEYFWEPAAGCWSVREAADGSFAAEKPESVPDPAPITTIAWRMWHIGEECLHGYTMRFFEGIDEWPPASWPGTAAKGLARLDECWDAYRAGAVAVGGEGLWRTLGPLAGPYADASYLGMLLHVEDEVIHHGAEIALLRDLYRQRSA